MSASTPVLRPRRADDVAPLTSVLWAQQSATLYPVRDSLPFPVEEFLHADDAGGAWVVEHAGRVVGHACWVRTVRAAQEGGVDPRTGEPSTAQDACAAAHGCRVDELAWVSAVFLDPSVRGLGLGGALLRTVVDDVRAAGLHPCLEVVDVNEAARRRYLADGWHEVLRSRPDWLAAAMGDDRVGTATMVLVDER